MSTEQPSFGLPVDWPTVSLQAAELLLGDPNWARSSEGWVRWGNRGSFALNRQTGYWRDFEAGTSGGVLVLIQRETGVDRTGAIEWLREQGLLEHRPIARTAPSQEKRPRQAQKSAPWRIAAVQALWWASEPIPMDQAHPARLWMAERNLWRPQFPVPSAVRWVPAEAEEPFRGLHQGAGSIIVPLASPRAWEQNWPQIPLPNAVSLVSIDMAGQPALDRPPDHLTPAGAPSPGLSKRTYGSMTGSIFLISTLLEHGAPPLMEAEGVADALGVAARMAGPVMVAFGTPARLAGDEILLEWICNCALQREVHLLADLDEAGQNGAVSLRAALLRRGVPLSRISVYTPPEGLGKDAADVCRAQAFEPMADAWDSYADTIRRGYVDWPYWEVARVSDCETLD